MTTDRSPEDVLGQLTTDLGGSLGTVLTGLGIRCGLWEALSTGTACRYAPAEPTSWRLD